MSADMDTADMTTPTGGPEPSHGHTGRSRSDRTTDEVAEAAARMIRAVGRRLAEDGDGDGIALLVGLHQDIDRAITAAVAGCRQREWSWADLGRVLGISKQAAQQRYGKATP